MPADENKRKWQVNIWLEKALMKTLPEMHEGIPINEIVRQVTNLYPISDIYVKRRIQECYVDLGYVRDIEGILFNEVKK
jgi:hypothetical protein